ncbi:MAG: DMT family transporter [Cyanobacteria bacterium P01_A01_bin.45]
MSKITNSSINSGKLFLWIAVIIFGAANSITRLLTEIGEQNLIAGRNPISFCNLLFIGNVCALLLLISVYYRQLNLSNFKQVSGKDWLNMSIVALLSGALAPALIFSALDRTMVTNVVLIGRLETPLALFLSVWFLKARINIWTILGAIISLLGVATTFLLQGIWESMMSPSIFATVGVGEIMTAVAALSLAIATIISQARLQSIPLGIFSVYRTGLATIIFFIIAMVLYGPGHFMDVFSPFLWQWMLVYSAVIVVIGQLSWFTGLKNSTPSDVSLASSFTPVAGILAAFLILGEIPTNAQYIGGTVILLGIFLNQIGIQKQNTQNIENSPPKEMETSGGFRGM